MNSPWRSECGFAISDAVTSSDPLAVRTSSWRSQNANLEKNRVGVRGMVRRLGILQASAMADKIVPRSLAVRTDLTKNLRGDSAAD